MRMSWRFSIEVFAVLVSYLIITLPVSGATEVNIYIHGDPYGGDPINLDYSDIVEKSVVINNPGESAGVDIFVSNATLDRKILEFIVYKCDGDSPADCIGRTPITYENDKASYSWSDVRDTGTGYPQTANIMTLVKVKRAGGFSWLGYWDVITRTGESDFTVDSREIDEIEVHTDVSYIISITDFITNFFMIPTYDTNKPQLGI